MTSCRFVSSTSNVRMASVLVISIVRIYNVQLWSDVQWNSVYVMLRKYPLVGSEPVKEAGTWMHKHYLSFYS
jgi:hypothetical protein